MAMNSNEHFEGVAMVFKHLRYALMGLVFCGSWVQANPLDYALTPKEIAPNTWVVTGLTEDFTTQNGGNIVNTAFIVTQEGVLVLDTGPSKRYGEALRQVISEVTEQPIARVYNSHHHPDHFLGNQAFADVDIYALATTIDLIKSRGEAYTENMYRMVGDWMRGTDVLLPNQIQTSGQEIIGGHSLRFMAFSGHSGAQADLVILDETTGVLFAFDLVFYDRALTTPDTPGLMQWLEDIEALSLLDFKTLVPGHGEVTSSTKPLEQMREYLKWLDQVLTDSAAQGLVATEVMRVGIPERFSSVALAAQELQRTVSHLYPNYEDAFFAESF
ncbi:quinoprotein relay system zinc metallohydrolase 1 [Nitrincola tibetensis]|nr:quinoprotein relay system zinc metallohydrolase 1 [Nitrincola tibetensis]